MNIMLASIFLAAVFAEAKVVTCNISVQKTDRSIASIEVSSKVLEESDIRYKLNVYSEVVKRVKNPDLTMDYTKLILSKELCSEKKYTAPEVTEFVNQGKNSLLLFTCGNGNKKSLTFDTNKLKTLPLKTVFERLDNECQK